MNSIKVWKGRAVGIGSWFLEDPQRLAAVVVMASLILSTLGVLGYISGLETHGIRLAPNPGGGSGGPGY